MSRKYQESLERCQKAINLEIPDRIPVVCKVDPTFAIQYAGFNMKEALWNVDLLEKAFAKVYEDFYFDAGGYMGRFPLFYKTMEAKSFVQNERDGSVQHPEVSGLFPEEYDLFIKDPYKCIVETVVPRLYPRLGEGGIEGGLNWGRAINANNRVTGKIVAGNIALANKYGVPNIRRGIMEAPFDFLADLLRGFSGISMDVRRCPEKVKEAAEAAIPLMAKLAKLSNPTPGTIASVFMPLHMPSYLRTKDFEKLYWPSFKALVEEIIEAGYSIQIFFEKNWTRYYEFLQDLPKKGIIGYFEEDDLGVVKEKLGKNMCIMGNMPLSILRTGTPQQCIDVAKEIIDKGAPGGGYLFTTDKSLLTLNDVIPENFRAVNEFVHNYGIYN
ncbi:MAG: uroporphyrinogen decarboxylase family protein [Eubacteriaceae bacterium]